MFINTLECYATLHQMYFMVECGEQCNDHTAVGLWMWHCYDIVTHILAVNRHVAFSKVFCIAYFYKYFILRCIYIHECAACIIYSMYGGKMS